MASRIGGRRAELPSPAGLFPEGELHLKTDRSTPYLSSNSLRSMGIFDWLNPDHVEEKPSDLSRRAFFARLAVPVDPPKAPEPVKSETTEPDDDESKHLFTFYVDRFRYHDGPILVPMLKVGMEFKMAPDPYHLTDPGAVKIQMGRDNLGYVPAEFADEVKQMLSEKADIYCRSIAVNPVGDLDRVLRVAIGRVDAEEDEDAETGGDESGPGVDPDSRNSALAALAEQDSDADQGPGDLNDEVGDDPSDPELRAGP